MPKKQLLLPGAKSAILVGKPLPLVSPWWRRGALLFGVVAVVIGGIDMVNRAAASVSSALTEDIAFTAFAPATLLLNPELRAPVQNTPPTPITPARLVIPAINVEARVEPVGKTADGAMATPKALADVAWYEPGAKPGQSGNAVFAGHVNNALGLPGVFKNLSKLKVGEEVRVQSAAGETLVYQVESRAVYKENEAPLEEIFANSGPSGLVLITCEGVWDEATRSFDERLVVVARLK